MDSAPEEKAQIGREILKRSCVPVLETIPQSDCGSSVIRIRARAWGDLPDVVERLLESKAADLDEAAIIRQAAETLRDANTFAVPRKFHQARRR